MLRPRLVLLVIALGLQPASSIPVVRAAEPEFVRKINVGPSGGLGLTGLAIDDAAGRLYVADRSDDRIHVFDLDGNPVQMIGGPGNGPGQFEDPADLQLTSTGELLVADWVNYRVQVLGLDGTFIRQWGSHGTGPGQFDSPVDIAIDAAGFVYVADSGLSRVQKFTLGGQYLKTWGSRGSGQGQFSGCTGVAVTPTGEIVIADQGNNRLEFYDSEGTWLRRIDLSGAPHTQPCGVHVDGNGRIFIAGFNLNSALCLAPDGSTLLRWAALVGPWTRVATDAAGLIYLSPFGGRDVYVYGFPTAVRQSTWSAVKALLR